MLINKLLVNSNVEEKIINIIQIVTGYPINQIKVCDEPLKLNLALNDNVFYNIIQKIRVEFIISEVDLPADNNISLRDICNVVSINSDTTKVLSDKINKYAGENISNRYVPVSIEKEYDLSSGRIFSFKDKKFIVIEDRMGGIITEELVNKVTGSGGEVRILSPNAKKYGKSGINTDFNNLEDFKVSLEHAKMQLQDVHGFIYLYPLVRDFSFFECKDELWYREVDNNFNLLFYTVRTLYDSIEKHGLEAGCFAATFTGGIFGMEKQTSYNPMGALTSGFIKSLEKEFHDFSGKVVDLTEIIDDKNTSELLFKEFSLIEELIEIGYVRGKRKTICVVPHSINTETVSQPLLLSADDVILVSGGGRGILFETIKGLAEVYNPTIIITGRTPLPNGDEEWLNMTNDNFTEYSKQFFIHMKLKNPKLTPIMIKKELEKIKSAIELYNNIKLMHEAGFNINYIQCDVANKDSVKQLSSQIIEKFGKVTGIVNGAGLPSFGKVPKKPELHSLTVVRVKANGFYNLYNEFSNQPLKFFASIGSISGRFGMDGQVDYAGGADIIARLSFQMYRKRPEIKCFVIGWTAWDEVGMASSPEVQKVQKEQRGLDYISTKEGIFRFLTELAYGGDYPEVLYYGSLGTNKPLGQMDILSDDGKSIKDFFGKHGEVTNRIVYPLLQRVTNISDNCIEAEKDLFLEEDIYLKDHLVEGKYVYAGVMHLETYCQLGKMLNAVNNINCDIHATRLRNVEFKKFIKCFEDSPLTLRFKAEIVEKDNRSIELKAEIKSDFVNKKGMVLERDRLHSIGYVKFEEKSLPQTKAEVDVLGLIKTSRSMNIEKYYEYADKYISFGPTFRCLNYVGYISEEVVVGEITVPHDNEIFSYTAMSDTIISPVSIDNLARFMLFAEYQKSGYTIIPKIIKDAVLYRPAKKGEKLFIHCRQLKDEGQIVNFRAIAVDKNNNLVFDMVDLESIRITKEDGPHNLF